jgi:signal transduction histidine kinase
MKTENEVFLKNPHTTLADAQALASSNLEEVNRMTDMVENLLMLARSKKSDMKIEMESVDISKIAGVVINNLRKSAEAKNISLALRPAPSVSVQGNTRLLEQAVSNIIQNAIVYTEKGSIKVLIDSGSIMTLKVIDTGIGISKADLPHVLEPFFKADASRNKASGGMGLGLSIVKEIVGLHKGTISLESEPGKGTTVTVILPTSLTKSS